MGEVRRPTYTVKVKDPETGEERRETRQSGVWWLRYYRNGKRHEESSHSTRKKDAIDLLRQREGDLARGVPVSAKVGQLRFEDAVAMVVQDYSNDNKRSLANVERRIKLHLAPVFGGRRMASISTDDASNYSAARLEAGAKPATVNRELAVLKRAFSLAKIAQKLLFVPHIPMLKEENVRQGFFENDQFEDVRKALPENLRGIVTFAYLVGWRVPSEVLTLEWERNVDRVRKTVKLLPSQTKNGKGRTLAYDLLPELDEVIETQWASHELLTSEGVLCPSVFHRGGAPIKSLRGAWQTACAKAGLPGMLVHDLRRTAVRNLVRANVSQNIAMQVTGHLTPSVFARYDITTGEDVRQGLGKLAGKEKGKSDRSGRIVSFPSTT